MRVSELPYGDRLKNNRAKDKTVVPDRKSPIG